MPTLRDYRSQFAGALAFADAWRPVGRLNAVRLAVWTSPFTGALAILLFLYLLLRLRGDSWLLIAATKGKR